MEDIIFKTLNWDSEQLGIKCGSIIFTDGCASLQREAVSAEIKRIVTHHNGFDFISMKLPDKLSFLSDDLIKLGANIIDRELIFKFKSLNYSFDHTYSIAFQKTVDKNYFIPLADEMRYSRFYLDKNIPNDKARNLWIESIKNYCTGRTDILAIAYAGNLPVGLAAMNFTGPKRIDLQIAAVCIQHQGRGVGRALISGITKKYSNDYDIFVETLSLNNKAVKLYQRCGFILDSMQDILHIWPSKK